MNRIKELREELKISQNELAKKLNKTQQMVSLYENGTYELDLDGYLILSKLFNCSIEYIAGKSDKRNNEDSKKELEIKWALSGGYNALNDTNREIARSVIESLLAKQEQEEKGKK